MSKSFKYENEEFFEDDFDFAGGSKSYKNYNRKKNDKKREIQKARRERQAQRDEMERVLIEEND